MSIEIFRTKDSQYPMSNGRTFLNPLVFEYSAGSKTITQRYWVKNTSVGDTYTGYLYAGKPTHDTWFRFAEDFGDGPGSWGLDFDFVLPPGEALPFWIKLTVPELENPEQMVDLSIAALVEV